MIVQLETLIKSRHSALSVPSVTKVSVEIEQDNRTLPLLMFKMKMLLSLKKKNKLKQNSYFIQKSNKILCGSLSYS